MRPPIPRFVRWTVVFSIIAALVFALFQYWSTAQVGSSAQAGPVIQTAWGPLTAADRDLLARVRQAGLWEVPTGQLAEQQGSTVPVRELGGLIAAEHADLDNRVRETAAQLGVVLPNQPTEQQQGWMAEIAAQTGSDFDRVFVQRLRAAHGTVLPIIAEVRAGTRNELVRGFAETAAEFVTRHCQYLESTGLVDFSALPEPSTSSGAAQSGPVQAAAPVAGAPAAPQAPVPPGSAPPVPAPPAPATTDPAPASAPAPGVHQHGVGVQIPDGLQQAVGRVASVTSVGGANVMIAALVYVTALLAIVGLLVLVGTAGARSRATAPAARRAASAAAPAARRSGPRHAARRW